MKNPVKKNMDFFNKPSIIEHSYEKEYLKLLDEEIAEAILVPEELLKRMEGIRKKAEENKKYSILDRKEYLYDNECDDNDIGCSTISID